MSDPRAFCSQCGLRIRNDLVGWLVRFERNGAVYMCPRCRPDQQPFTPPEGPQS